MTLVEANHLGHFKCLPEILGFKVSDIDGVTVINCGLNSSMFNIAYGMPSGVDVEATIQRVTHHFNGLPFAWWVPPSKHNATASAVLAAKGFVVETAEHAMVCNLNAGLNLNTTTQLDIQHVTNKQLLEHFIRVLQPYDANVGVVYGKLTAQTLRGNEQLFVGYENGVPVTIGVLFVNSGSAGIFSLITLDAFRGKVYGRDMMTALMQRAKDCGCESVTLSASSDAGYRIYERLGFVNVGEFECFEHFGCSKA